VIVRYDHLRRGRRRAQRDGDEARTGLLDPAADLERALIAAEGEDSGVGKAVGGKGKEWLSVALYAAAIGLAFVSPWISVAIYLGVSAMWLIPDRRFERAR